MSYIDLILFAIILFTNYRLRMVQGCLQESQAQERKSARAQECKALWQGDIQAQKKAQARFDHKRKQYERKVDEDGFEIIPKERREKALQNIKNKRKDNLFKDRDFELEITNL
jgi:hypothetical protein